MCQSLEFIEQVLGHPSPPLVHYEPISWGVNITPLCHRRGEGRYLAIFITIVSNGFLAVSKGTSIKVRYCQMGDFQVSQVNGLHCWLSEGKD